MYNADQRYELRKLQLQDLQAEVARSRMVEVLSQRHDALQRWPKNYSQRLRRTIIIAAVFIVLIAGAVGYGLFGRSASVQGGPERTGGNVCASCHIGYAAPYFSGPAV